MNWIENRKTLVLRKQKFRYPMSLTIYVYSKCSTCKEAIQFLKTNKIPFISKEITHTPPTIPEIHRMLKYLGENLKKLFNSSGNLYKELNLSKKLPDISLDESLEMLSHHGMLVKRPFLLGKDFGIVGFKKEEWDDLLVK